jgi:hypothetical protein
MSPTGKPRTKKTPPAPTPKQPKLWDPPPSPEIGDKSADDTFLAVGKALTEWEKLESAFSRLFGGFLGMGDHSLAASRAYGSVLTFRGRSEMVTAAAEAFYFEKPDADLERVTKEIIKRSIGFSARRNEIAHGVVAAIYVDDDVIQTPEGGLIIAMTDLGFAVRPSNHATNKTTLKESSNLLTGVERQPRYTYSSVEITLISHHFISLAEDVRDLWFRVLKHDRSTRRSEQR